MPKKPSGNFDQQKYIHEWNKEHMMTVRAAYSSGFVKEFKEACTILNISQSSVFREAMIQTIEKAQKKNQGD